MVFKEKAKDSSSGKMIDQTWHEIRRDKLEQKKKDQKKGVLEVIELE